MKYLCIVLLLLVVSIDTAVSGGPEESARWFRGMQKYTPDVDSAVECNSRLSSHDCEEYLIKFMSCEGLPEPTGNKHARSYAITRPLLPQITTLSQETLAERCRKRGLSTEELCVEWTHNH